MMLPTHVLVGFAVGAPVALIAPEFATAALAGAGMGSAFPDFDLYAGHRRNLHYPTGYSVAATIALLAAMTVPSAVTVFAALVFVGAAVHCQMDRYGGGLELRPWEATSQRAVYDHYRGRWLPPKRWIRYDGAPEDVVLMLLLAGGLVVTLEGYIEAIILAMATIGTVYGLLRRRLAALAPSVIGILPGSLASHVPARYHR
ncbi:MAG: metal-dependent hydrolase [Salinirussus sp.]